MRINFLKQEKGRIIFFKKIEIALELADGTVDGKGVSTLGVYDHLDKSSN